MANTEVLGINPVAEQENNKAPDLQRQEKIRAEIIDAVTSVAGDPRVQGFIGDFFAAVAKEREDGKQLSFFSGIRIFYNSVLSNSNFWYSLYNHGSKMILMLKCLAPSFFPEYGEAIKSQEFTEAISQSEEIKNFIKGLSAHKDALEKTIAYFLTLPIEDQTAALDQQFIKKVLDFVELNKDKIKSEDLAAIAKLVLERGTIEARSIIIDAETINKEKLENNLKIANKGLEILSQFEGFEDLLSYKKAYVGALICAEKIKGVTGFITPEDAIKILNEILTDKNIKASLAEGRSIVDEMLIGPLNIMKVGAKEMRFIAENFPETLAIVSKSPEIILLQCFDAEEKDGNITYKISALGKQMIEMCIIKLPEGQSVKTFKATVAAEGNTLDVFKEKVLSGFNTELFRDFLPITTNPILMEQLSHVVGDLGNDMPLFSYLPKLLQVIKDNPKFAAVLEKHQKQITEITKIAAEQIDTIRVNLQKFGLTKEFLEVTSTVLNSESLQKLYEISVAIGSDNNSDMTAEAIKWLAENEKLVALLQKPSYQKELANLVKACGDKNQGDIAVVREYFDRPEFALLKDLADKGLIDMLPSIMKFLTPEFLGTLNKVMENGAIINGFATLDCVTNIKERPRAEEGLKQVYFYLIEGSSWDDKKIEEQFAIFGIKTKETLEANIQQAKINSIAIKLRNEINGIFKADLPEEKAELTEAEQSKYQAHVRSVKETQAAERSVVLTILSQGETLEDVKQALETANKGEKISTGNYRLLADRLNQISPEKAKLVFERILYEDKIREVEMLGMIKTPAGITVNELSWEVIESLSKEVGGIIDKNITVDKFREILETTDVLSQQQKVTLLKVCFDGKQEIPLTTLYNMLRDGACRLKGGEGVGELQTMLGSLLAPVVQTMKVLYGLNLSEVEKMTTALDANTTESFTAETLKTFLSANSKTARIEELVSYVMSDQTEISPAELKKKFGEIGQEYNATVSFMKKFMEALNTNPVLNKFLLTITLRKGDLGDTDIKLVAKEFLVIIAELDPQERKAFNKLIPDLLNGLNLPILDPYRVKAFQDIIVGFDKTKIDSVTDLLKALLVENKSVKEKVLGNLNLLGAGIKAGWQNLGTIASAGFNLAKGELINGSQSTVEKLVNDLKTARETNQPLDVKGLLDRNANALISVNLSGDFLGAKFEGLNFYSTNFNGNFNDSKFIKCNFTNSKLTEVNFNGVTFDLASFNSLAENVGLLTQHLKGAKVQFTTIKNPIDAKFVYGLQQYCKAAGLPFNASTIIDAQKCGVQYSDLTLFTDKGWMLIQSAIGKSSIPTLQRIMDLKTQLKEKGLTSDLLEKYSEEIRNGEIKEKSYEANPLEAIKALAVKGALARVDSKIESETLRVLDEIKSLNSEVQKALGAVVSDIFPGGFKPISITKANYIHSEVPYLLDALGKASEQIKDLNPEQVKELSEFLKLNKDLKGDDLQNELDALLTALNSQQYEKIASITSALGISEQAKFDLYKKLAFEEPGKLDQYAAALKGFNSNGNLNSSKNASAEETLSNWYLQRAAGKMSPEEARSGKLTTIECLDKAVEYKKLIPLEVEAQSENVEADEFYEILSEDEQNRTTASLLAKAIMAKLSGDRYLTVADRTSELESIYLIAKAKIDQLSLEDKAKLEGVISEVATEVYNSLYSSAQREKLSPINFYILVGTDIGKLTSETVSKGAFVESVLKASPQHSKYRAELYKLDVEELRAFADLEATVQKQMFEYANRAKKTLAEIIAMRAEVSKVEEIIATVPALAQHRDELYGLKSDVLDIIKENPQAFAERSAVEIIPGYVWNGSDNSVHNQMYSLNAAQLKEVLGMSDEVFAKTINYCKRSDKTMPDMLEHKNIVDNLENLSKEIETRYKLAGEKNPEKFCLNVVLKIYNDLPQEVKAFVKDKKLHSLIADIGFNAIQREKLDPSNTKQLESFSATVVSKIDPKIHTPEFAKQAIEQGKQIADEVFKKLDVQKYLKGDTAESQANFANIIASRIFVKGELIQEREFAKVIGEVKPGVGYFSTKYAESTGCVSLVLKQYGTTTSYNSIGKFDKDRSPKLIEGLDQLISGQAIGQQI